MRRQMDHAALAILILTAAAPARANLFDLSDFVGAGDTPANWLAGRSIVSATGGVTATFTFSDGAGILASSSPFMTASVNGFDHGLEYRVNGDDASASASGVPRTQFVRLTIGFDSPISDASFAMGDIDTGGTATGSRDDSNPNFPNWQDVVVVSGSFGGAEVATAASGLGSAVRLDTGGNIYTTSSNDVTLRGDDGDIPPSSTAGNATISFASTIDQIVIDYHLGDNNDGILGDGPENPTSQLIRMHDISFSAIPEGSSFAFLAAVSTLATVVRGRRRS